MIVKIVKAISFFYSTKNEQEWKREGDGNEK
jgi:hypothetical protein